jgi:hypothetical protein
VKAEQANANREYRKEVAAFDEAEEQLANEVSSKVEMRPVAVEERVIWETKEVVVFRVDTGAEVGRKTATLEDLMLAEAVAKGRKPRRGKTPPKTPPKKETKAEVAADALFGPEDTGAGKQETLPAPPPTAQDLGLTPTVGPEAPDPDDDELEQLDAEADELNGAVEPAPDAPHNAGDEQTLEGRGHHVAPPRSADLGRAAEGPMVTREQLFAWGRLVDQVQARDAEGRTVLLRLSAELRDAWLDATRESVQVDLGEAIVTPKARTFDPEAPTMQEGQPRPGTGRP